MTRGIDGCSLAGFHMWSKWSEPTGTIDQVQYQERQCIRCNQAQIRKVERVE